jgi:hypothetical protein
MKLACFRTTAFLLGGAATLSWYPLGAGAFPLLHENHRQVHRLQAATSDALPPRPASPTPTKSKRTGPRRFKKVSPAERLKSNVQGPSKLPESIPSLSEIMTGLTVDDFRGEIVDQREVAAERSSQASRLQPRTKDASNSRTRDASNSRWGGKRPVARGQQTPARNQRPDTPKQTRTPPNGQQTNVRNQRPARPKQTITAPTEPWKASYQVSMSTQAMLKATAVRMTGRPDHERAVAVLAALVNTPPEKVNEANVVCALTLSAKCMNPRTQTSSELRSLLLQVFDILKIMVEQGQLKARQLCNAIYAIAKHYNTDDSILPPPATATAMSKDGTVGVAEAWILQDEDENTPENRLESTIEMIAARLTASLEDDKKHGPRKPKVGEVSMACWAYGVLRQRVRPPGWEVPPQLSRLPSNQKPRSALKNVKLVTFEQWAVNSDDSEPVSVHDPVGLLFDAIGHFLCEEYEDADGMKMLVQDMSWSEIANVAWAFANHGHCRTEASERLMVTLAQEATTRLQVAAQPSCSPSFLPRDISQLVWSIGTLQSDNFRLGDDLAKVIDATAMYYLLADSAKRPLQDWSSADLVQLAIALAHGRIDHLQLLRALFQEACARVLDDVAPGSATKNAYSFHEWEISVLLWVQARLFLKEEQGQEFQDFVQQSTRWLMQRAKGAASLEALGIGAQEQANLAWSLTVLEEYESPDTLSLLRTIFREASITKNEYIQLEHAHQLWQALYLMEYEFPEAVEDVPPWFRDFLKEKWSVEKARQKISSARHKSLSQLLDLMGVAHFNEHDEDIDVAIVLKDNSSWTHEAKKADHNVAQFKVGKSACALIASFSSLRLSPFRFSR